MGNWTIYLNSKEEEQIKRLIERGEFPSFYSAIRSAVALLLRTKERIEKVRENAKD